MKTIEDRKIQMECILILGANLLWHKYNLYIFLKPVPLYLLLVSG